MLLAKYFTNGPVSHISMYAWKVRERGKTSGGVRVISDRGRMDVVTTQISGITSASTKTEPKP